MDKVVLGVFGSEQPNQEDCRSEAMGSVEYVIEDLSDGTYLCYHTDQGLPGWVKIVQLDSIQMTYFNCSTLPGRSHNGRTWALYFW